MLPRDCGVLGLRGPRGAKPRRRPHGDGRAVRRRSGRGFWKLVSRVFVENSASRALLKAVGFREVGTYEKHGQLDGVWRDVVIVERLL